MYGGISSGFDIYFEALFYAVFLVLVYTYLLYPLLLVIIAKAWPAEVKENRDYKPDITIIIAAYNEEDFLEGAVESIFLSDYPKEKISVLIGSDGSDDKTAHIAHKLKAKYGNISVHEFGRCGKNRVLNQLTDYLKTDIALFMDADLRLNTDTIGNLVAKFADSSIGAVLATLDMIDVSGNENAGRSGETLYQKYETIIRLSESAIKSTVNSLGFYGMKKELIKKIPNNDVCDDMFNIFSANLQRKRAILITDSNASEVRGKSLKGEIKRRVRLVAGGISTVVACKSLLNPRYGWPALFIISHKVLRYATPLIMITILIISLLLTDDSHLKYPLLIGQATLYLTAFLGWALEKTNIKIRAFRIPLFFVSMNVGFLLGIFRFLAGGQNAAWERHN